MAQKTLYDLKQESRDKKAKNGNTITDADYRLRDKTGKGDKKNTVYMTEPLAVKLEREKREAEEAKKVTRGKKTSTTTKEA